MKDDQGNHENVATVDVSKDSSVSEYQHSLAFLDSLRQHAQDIASRLRPQYKSYGVEEFDIACVQVTCYWPNYDSDLIDFPAEWLFRADWEQLVDARLLDELHAENNKKIAARAQDETREREQLKRLQAKYLPAPPAE